MRLDIALMHRPGVEASLDDHVGLFEAGLDIAQLVLKRAGNIRRFAFELDEVVQNRGARLDCILDLDHPGQHFVIDFDQLAGLPSDLAGSGCDRRDRMAVEQGFLARHDVAAHPAHVLNAERHRRADGEIDNVLGRDNGFYTRQRLGL